MNLLTPDPGLLVWSLISFLILLALLGKYAWKPIIHALKVREETIEYSLRDAERARTELINIEKTQKMMLDQARVERDEMIKEAQAIKKSIIEEARQAAKSEAEKLMITAKMQIENQKQIAIDDLRNQVAILSLDIATRLLQRELENPDRQKELIQSYLKEATFN